MTPHLGPLEHYMAFLTQLDVLLTCDTGAMHIAGALGVPTLAVFGMTEGSKRTGYYPSVTYLNGQADCSPCERITHDPPCDHEFCMAIANIPCSVLADKTLEVHCGANEIDGI